ncbi:glycosyltransferase [Lysinibacillus sp. NPDC093688]|uniref:glycosyltransferase n=1 Tax=Lysinibacillus sp. NPDC093688 TaxID=3390577 RepID=UPI003CFCA347
MNNDLEVIFLGGLFPKEKEMEILKNSIGNIQNAANNLQWAIVDGLDLNLHEPTTIINSMYIGSFPKRYKSLTIDTFKFSHTGSDSLKDINVGFVNLTGIKHISRYLSLKPYLKKWAASPNGKKKVIIAYAMTSTFANLLKLVKKINTTVITCMIVPDLPQYMTLEKNNEFYNVMKKIEIKSIKNDMKYIDGYVILTKHMREALKIKVPTVVIEGISTSLFENIDRLPIEKGIKSILYSGGLIEKYGVINLVRSFQKLSGDHYRLIICGAGNAESEIIQASQIDKRIIFKGLLKREEVLQLQKSATILVNPRPNNEEYTKFSFPSKILEYMSSGTPVISYELDGIPSEYYDYIYPVSKQEDGLFITLKEVLSKPDDELAEKGLRAKEFVYSEKTSAKQAEKILNLIRSIDRAKQ